MSIHGHQSKFVKVRNPYYFPSATLGGLRRSLLQIRGLVELCDVGHPQKGIPVAGIDRDFKHGRQEVTRNFPRHLFSLRGFFEGFSLQWSENIA